MGRWSVSGHEELELGEVRAIELEISDAEVSITTGAGPARIEVERVDGHPVDVVHADGVLEVRQRHRGFRLQRGTRHRDRCVVRLVVPAEAGARIRAVAGPVVVAGIRGGLDLTTVAGNVFLDDVDGRIEVRTVTGDVEASRLRGPLHVRTVSGDVIASAVECRSVTAHSVSGDLTLDCAVPPSDDSGLSTVSGRIVLRMPSEPVADVRLRSIGGTVSSTFALQPDAGLGSWATAAAEVHGDDTPRIDLRSVSGRLALLGRAAPA